MGVVYTVDKYHIKFYVLSSFQEKAHDGSTSYFTARREKAFAAFWPFRHCVVLIGGRNDRDTVWPGKRGSSTHGSTRF